MSTVMNFEEWLNKNEDDLDCEWGESGRRDEADADKERWLNDRYDEYATKA